MIVLIYIGDGSGLPGLPARDITAEELKASKYQLAQLLASGLYVQQATATAKQATKKKLGSSAQEE